jgi:hypothetical protein
MSLLTSLRGTQDLTSATCAGLFTIPFSLESKAIDPMSTKT